MLLDRRRDERLRLRFEAGSGEEGTASGSLPIANCSGVVVDMIP